MQEILGLIMLYATGHFFVIQQKGWANLNQYEKVVSVVAMISIALIYIGIITE